MPAKRLETRVPAMAQKGRVRVGADADVTIFDAGRIIDQATVERPVQPSQGVQYVLVNGTVVVDDGKIRTGVAPGRPIRAPFK
jgi:N-acyl-D-aspartate/D-glutamate deacylase